MKGNESGLGDPVEDAVSIGALHLIENPRIIYKALISIGLGADRFNDVSDCSSLRAISEITSLGGFMGSISLEKDSESHEFYKECLEHIYRMQSFRSVLSGSILASIQGCYGNDFIPELMGNRVHPGGLFIWPLMSILWAFDVNIVARRSLIVNWIKDCRTSTDSNIIFNKKRSELYTKKRILDVEELPKHTDYSICHNYGMKPVDVKKDKNEDFDFS
jgi:hypothetical protein